MIKKPFIFTMLALSFLAACGSSSQAPTPEPHTVTFPAPGSDTPAPTPDVTSLGSCGALPGQWKFKDIATGTDVSFASPASSAFQDSFQKSWGGTTTAYTTWDVESSGEPVWNEGRTLHVGSSASVTTTGMIRSIALTGVPSNMTALVGTDTGLVIVDFVRDNKGAWAFSKQTETTVVGPITSIATTKLTLESTGPLVPLVFMVASDAVLIAKLDDLRAGGGCASIAYQAKDHPVDPSNPANKRNYRPIKVVALNGLAAFLTASRPAEDFANATQLKSVLNQEWPSFQSTAYLIDLLRETPVEPFITSMGNFDRFFVSDISMSDTSIYLYGTRYASGNPATVECGIASYQKLVGTPVASMWSAVPAKLGGNFRMGRFDVKLANAYIRGLDLAAKVENFWSGPTEQKWAAWPNALSFDYTRSVSFRFDGSDESAVSAPQFIPNGVTALNWSKKTDSTTSYVAQKKLINATATDVDFLDVNGNVVHQRLQGGGIALFPIFEPNDTNVTANHPRIFHVGQYLFYVRHGSDGPSIQIFQDNIQGVVDISQKSIALIQKGPAIMRFKVVTLSGKDCTPGNIICTTKSISAFSNMQGDASNYRIDDIRIVSNPALPNLQHFVMLIHSWNGATNDYRIVALQANLSLTDKSYRRMSIQACSDSGDPNNNYSGNSTYGNPDEQLKFLRPLTISSNNNGTLTYSGYFQHSNPSYNVWSLNINVTPQELADEGSCTNMGELTPVMDPTIADSLSATFNDSTLIGLHTNGMVKWAIDAKTTQYLDVGTNYFGNPVTLDSGKIVPAGSQFITQMDSTDGFHPTALFPLNGSGGENCPLCQFTDIASSGSLVLTANPERGVELYNFSK